MSAALPERHEVRGEILPEDDDDLRSHGAVLRHAEGEDVDTGTPGQVRRSAAERGDRVRETRAVHVHAGPARVRELAQSAKLLDAIQSPRFGGLREAQA